LAACHRHQVNIPEQVEGYRAAIRADIEAHPRAAARTNGDAARFTGRGIDVPAVVLFLRAIRIVLREPGGPASKRGENERRRAPFAPEALHGDTASRGFANRSPKKSPSFHSGRWSAPAIATPIRTLARAKRSADSHSTWRELSSLGLW